jgi:hypothetical protein
MPFDLDDFGVAAAGTEARPVLSWRESPETSLADWTLKIVVAQADSSERRATEYHCHKTALGVGPRSLPYFERIFQGSGLAEHAVGTSEIELQASAADAIPVLLDYVYQGTLEATTANAAALMYLSRYFHGHAAFTAVQDFIQKDLNYKTAPIYLAEATLYSLEKAAASAADLCAEHCDSIKVGALNVLTAPLLLSVLQSTKLKHTSEHLSLHVASFCGAHAKELNGGLLLAMTTPSLIPTVHADAALPLLHLALKYKTKAGLADLRKRCTQATSVGYRQLFAAAGCAASPAAIEPDEPTAKRQRQAGGSAAAAAAAASATGSSDRPAFRGLKLPDQVKIDVLDGALGLAHSQLDVTASELKDTKAALAVERLENQKKIKQLTTTLVKFNRVPKTARVNGKDDGTRHIHSTENETYYNGYSSSGRKYQGAAPAGLPPGHTDTQGYSVPGSDLGLVGGYGSVHSNRSLALFYYSP